MTIDNQLERAQVMEIHGDKLYNVVYGNGLT